MPRYKMEGGGIVDTRNATESWDESTRHDGRNLISEATGSQWNHETLHRSRRGRYYLEHTSAYQGRADYATWIDRRAAAAWLLANERELPEDLQELEEEVME